MEEPVSTEPRKMLDRPQTSELGGFRRLSFVLSHLLCYAHGCHHTLLNKLSVGQLQSSNST